MNPETIYSAIRNEQQQFYDDDVEVVEGYTFNQYENLKRIHLYLNSQFEDDTPYAGREKLFFNVVNYPCEVATKQLNIDTKHIRLWPMNPRSVWSTHLLEKELKLWLKTSLMGQILNQIAYETPRYGSVVLQKTKNSAKLVDLRRLVLDPTVETIKKSRFVHIIHYLTPSELREMASKNGWENVEDAIAKFQSTSTPDSYEDTNGNYNQIVSTPYIKVTERYGEVPESWVTGKKPKTDEKFVKSLFIVAGADEVSRNEQGQPIGDEGVILFKSQWNKEWPFKDFHYTKQKGRWQGVGIPEMLFDVQVRVNEIKNQKRVSMELSSMHIFQTRDNLPVRNVLKDLENGRILKVNSEITPLANEERNLPAFDGEEQSYMQHVDRLSFAYEAVRGESMPSSTPATNALLASQQATSVYAFKRENLSLFLQEFFNDLVVQQLLRDLTPEHIMRFTGSFAELQKLDDTAAEVFANDYIMGSVRGGEVPTPESVQLKKEEFKKKLRKLGQQRFIKIKEGLYKDAEFEFDFVITNEQVDPATLVTNLRSIITDIAQNPAIIRDPALRPFYEKYAQGLGISPAELAVADEQPVDPMQQMMQGQMPQGQMPQGQPNPLQAQLAQLNGTSQ
jgi:hypothetical protein